MSKNRKTQFNIGYIVLGLIGVFVLVGLIYRPYDPTAMDVTSKLAHPGVEHWFGCDQFGRDLFARVEQGLLLSVIISAISVFIGTVGGTVIGAVCGYFGGVVDQVLSTVIDVLFAIPSILLALVLVSLFGSNIYNIIIALGIAIIPSFAKMMRSEFITQSKSEYVKAAKMRGVSPMRLIFVHILPNTMPTFLSCVFISLNNVLLAEAGLSYLGIGIQPPFSSLGGLLSDGQGYLKQAPFYCIFPGIVLLVLLLGIGLISEGGSFHNAYSKRFKD